VSHYAHLREREIARSEARSRAEISARRWELIDRLTFWALVIATVALPVYMCWRAGGAP